MASTSTPERACSRFHCGMRAICLLFCCMVGGMLMNAQAQDTLRIVKSFQTLAPQSSYYKSGTVPDSAQFGVAVQGMGDIDRDGVPDLAVGMSCDSSGHANSDGGSVMIMFMHANGTVKSIKRITSYTDSLNIRFHAGDRFGGRLANMGDLNGDGMTDLAVSAMGDDDGGADWGAIYVLFLDTTARVLHYQKISHSKGGFSGTMTGGNDFGGALSNIGDMNNDGITDLAVGAYQSDDGGSAGSSRGGLWIMLMNTNGTVQGYRKYSASSTWPSGNPLTSGSQFGFSAAGLGDLDGDGYKDIAVSARTQGDNGRGRVYILFFNSTGGIKAYQPIGPGNSGNLGGLKTTITELGGEFGWSLSPIGDLNGDGVIDLAFGLNMKANGYSGAGAVLIGYLNTNGTLQHEDLISETTGAGGSLGLHVNAWFGASVSAMGDLDGDHVMDIAVDAWNWTSSGHPYIGRVYVMELNPKPLLITSISTQDATLSAAGKATLTVKGGIRPYELVWMDSIPTTARLNTWKASIDTAGFAALGMPQVLPNTLTASQLITLHAVDTAAMKSGVYPVVVKDVGDTVRYGLVHIGEQLVQSTLTGATLSGKDLTKTGSTGWSTMRFTSKNRLPAAEDGWVRFIVPAVNKRIAVGLSVADTSQVNGYQQMAYGFYLSSDSIWCWDGGSLHLITQKFKAGDQFRVERLADSVCFYHERQLLRTVHSAPMNVIYMADCSAYQNGAQIKQVTTSFQSSFHVAASLTHLPALTPSGGAVDLTITPNSGTYTYDWLDGPATTQDRSTLAQERYQVDITSSFFSDTQRSTLDVGSALHWKETSSYISDTTISRGVTLECLDTDTLWHTVASENLAVGSKGHWSQCSMDPALAGGALLGWRTSISDTIWACWWVHRFGNDLLANAVGIGGVADRVVVHKNDELRLSGYGEDSVRFLVNGVVVHTLARPPHHATFQLIGGMRVAGDHMSDVATSLAVPLRLNTAQYFPGIAYTFTTPDTITTAGTTESAVVADLGFGPLSSDHHLDIEATDSTDATTLLFKLTDGAVTDMRLVVNDTTYTMDSSSYVLNGLNELVFINGSEEAPDSTEVPAYIMDLERGLLMTPDGDDDHDVLHVLVNVPVVDYEFTVTDQADNILFDTNDPDEDWNGKYMNTGALVDNGVYRFHIQLDDLEDEGEFMVKH